MTVRFDGYIPIGCLVIPRVRADKDTQLLGLPEHEDFWSNAADLRQWSALLQHWEKEEELPASAQPHPGRALPASLHAKIIKASGIAQLADLLHRQWINLEFCVTSTDDAALFRVYVLPDDVDNLSIDRSGARLKKARRELLAKLDYSASAWAGIPGDPPRRSPEPWGPSVGVDVEIDVDSDREGPLSLLEMFNTIPSPDPFSEELSEPLYQSALDGLLKSDVPGLNTTLYPYQRRSTAVMLMREVQSAKDLDPRLLRVKDQLGRDWYFDAPASVILKEPRYYDRVRGGILAEQMGSGKTLMSLALILATKSLPAQPPAFRTTVPPERKGFASLADMAAACATANGIPWKWYFEAAKEQYGLVYENCLKAIDRNPGAYHIPPPEPRRVARATARQMPASPPVKVLLGHGSIVVVPSNLLPQWQAEIRKHTTGLNVLKVDDKVETMSPKELCQYDILLVTRNRLDRLHRSSCINDHPLTRVHFKRCIVDEGHMLGNSTVNSKSNLLLALDKLHISARWIVTGTPSRGLYGLDEAKAEDQESAGSKKNGSLKTSEELEKDDLTKIGAIASLYLKARPWANITEEGDTPAKWSVYVMQPKHTSEGAGRQSSLRATLNSLIVRHRLPELSKMLPTVNEKIVVLDGSYQDKLSLNVFSMMIIFNAVQSQRTDRDYFFHPTQRKALIQLVHNLKQACFFGGAFFSRTELTKSLETASTFLEEKKVAISAEDETLLKQAIDFAKVALANELKHHSQLYHEMPVFVQDFLPSGTAKNWSLDFNDGDFVCTNTTLVMDAQKLIRPALDDVTQLNSLLNGGLFAAGAERREAAYLRAREAEDETPSKERVKALAGDTKLGHDQIPKELRSTVLYAPLSSKTERDRGIESDHEIPEPFAKARLVSTASAKMSYLLDSIIEHQEQEQIIIFYENENMAWFLAGMLDVIRVRYLIYAKTLTTKRKDQYINTFNNDTKFRVLLMDITQAAFGLDMRAASRIYFMHPVLNPQIQAQAIGRVRRISQQKPVSVETLVLRGSVEEVIVERKNTMSQAEHWKCRSLLDDRPIYNWILNAGIIPLPEQIPSKLEQTAALKHPQSIFGSGFGREAHPDEDLWTGHGDDGTVRGAGTNGGVRGSTHLVSATVEKPASVVPESRKREDVEEKEEELADRPARRVRFG